MINEIEKELDDHFAEQDQLKAKEPLLRDITSRDLLKITRHGAGNIPIQSNGFIKLEDLIKSKYIRNLKIDTTRMGQIISDIVDDDEKNGKTRFLKNMVDNQLVEVRANQGHTNTKVKLEDLCSILHHLNFGYHATGKKEYESIILNGLLPIDRPIHMAQGLGSDVKSGIRRTKYHNHILKIDLNRLRESGAKLYLSDNGVILCNEPISPDFIELLPIV